ncbi:MAG: hypothetical protein D6799_03260, partial [Bacteroidetes bacterium]
MTLFKGIKQIVLFIWLTFTLFLHYHAQNNIQLINIHALNINSKDGLPTNHVNYVFKDNQGFYWIGTQSGLCKYDGYKIYLYKNNPKDSFSLKCSNVFSITQYQHYLILSCGEKVIFYDYYKNKFFENKIINEKLKNKNIYSIYVLNHKIFMAGETGLYEYNFKDSSLHQYSSLPSSLSYKSKFLHTPQHFLLCDINVGIMKIDTVKHTLKDKLNYLPDNPSDILQYGNNIYILYPLYGVLKVDAITLEKIDNTILFKDVFKNKPS